MMRRRGYGGTFKFDEGENGYERGLDREDCPHPEGSEERAQWLAGWEYAWWAQCGDNPMVPS